MKAIKQNHQIIYFHPQNAKGCALNLISFGCYQFKEIVKVKKISRIYELTKNPNKREPSDMEFILFELGMNQLIDCIRLTICFENFFKSVLILNGYVIHILDKNIFPELRKKQFERPVKLSEVLELKSWEINNHITGEELGMKKQINGILKNTIGMKELGKIGYCESLNIPSEIYSICQPYFNYRNNLHLYNYETINISKKEYNYFIKIIDFVNTKLINFQHRLVDEIGKGDSFKIPPILYPVANY